VSQPARQIGATDKQEPTWFKPCEEERAAFGATAAALEALGAACSFATNCPPHSSVAAIANSRKI